MAATVTIKGLEAFQAQMRDFSERRMNAAVATALTRTAKQTRDVVQGRLGQVFDRPTPYTLNALFFTGATAQRLSASVKFKDEGAGSGTPATKYLLPNVEGGVRRSKRFEVALQAAGHLPAGWVVTPGPGAAIDAYGNISKGQIIQVLSQLRITMTAGHTRNMSFDTGKAISAQRKAGGRFFVVKPGGRARPGVYQREFVGRSVTSVFWFVHHAAYKKRYDFDGEVQRVAEPLLQVEMARAVAEAATRLAARATAP
jgi:hypothetical protein